METVTTSPPRKGDCRAYLDIETTSLDPSKGELTVIGICLDDGRAPNVVQLVGREISATGIFDLLGEVKVLYTYNGERFDLPYIKASLGVDLSTYCAHHDLMYDCWRRNLYGGLKEVERQLGIDRKLTGIDGRAAVQLWFNYKLYDDKRYLQTLLEYNREDVWNLRVLREKLKV